jgi:hypothetical protein
VATKLACSGVDGRVAVQALLLGLPIAMLQEDPEQRQRVKVRALARPVGAWWK